VRDTEGVRIRVFALVDEFSVTASSKSCSIEGMTLSLGVASLWSTLLGPWLGVHSGADEELNMLPLRGVGIPAVVEDAIDSLLSKKT
jgi:hypothetical protein